MPVPDAPLALPDRSSRRQKPYQHHSKDPLQDQQDGERTIGAAAGMEKLFLKIILRTFLDRFMGTRAGQSAGGLTHHNEIPRSEFSFPTCR